MLDEPTNYLDILTRQALLDMLQSYPGTVLFASHDRQFIGKLADKLLLFDGGQINYFSGTYAEYQDRDRRTKNEQVLVLENELAAINSQLTFIIKANQRHELEKQYVAILCKLKELDK
ncbi:MAG: hypothetical protein RLZ12_647 [Bacillota bacterium]|jgi:macrolide transport system ATP-binding/permease protein